jgi:hypothetical protein
MALGSAAAADWKPMSSLFLSWLPPWPRTLVDVQTLTVIGVFSGVAIWWWRLSVET